MKIIHTSDWHLGQMLYNHDRTADHEEMFRQIAEIVREAQPDAVLVSGDVFHVAAPSSAAQRLLARGLRQLREACSSARIILTAGNHDGAARLQAPNEIFNLADIDLVGSVQNIEDADDLAGQALVRLKCGGSVLALPFIFPHRFTAGFSAALRKVAETAPQPLVVMAHAAVEGGDFRGHTKPNTDTVGGLDTVKAAVFGGGYSYLALGHIHHPQTISKGCGPVMCYSGSPVAVSFDEDYDHSVCLVEIDGQKAEVTRKVLTPSRPLKTLGGKDGIWWDEAPEVLERESAVLRENSYIRFNIRYDSDHRIPADADIQMHKWCAGHNLIYCETNPIYAGAAKAEGPAPRSLSPVEFRSIDPMELIVNYASDANLDFPEHLRNLMKEIIKKCEVPEKNED